MKLLGKGKEGDQSGDETQVALMDKELINIAKIIGLMIISAGVLIALTLAWPAIDLVISTLVPFVIALGCAYVFNPIVNMIERQLRFSRLASVIILYVLFLLLIVGFFAVVLPVLITQTQKAYGDFTGFIDGQVQRSAEFAQLRDQIVIWLESHGLTLDQLIFQNESVRQAATTAAGTGLRAVGGVLEFLYNIAMSVTGLAIAFSFVFLVNIYLLLDFSKLPKVYNILVPERHQSRTTTVLQKLDVAVGGFIRGTLIVATCIGVLQGTGIYILGITYIDGLQNYALLIALIAGIGALVPYLGTIAGGAPAVLFVLFTSSIEDFKTRMICLLLVLALIGLIQMIEGMVLQPKIVGEAAQLHPIAVIFALAMGSNFSIVGMILAVPAAAAIRVLIKEYYWDERVMAYNKRTKIKGNGKRTHKPSVKKSGGKS